MLMVALIRPQLCWSQKDGSTNTRYNATSSLGRRSLFGAQVPKLMAWLLLPFINSKTDL